ncbi:MAG: hypothetical protein AMJ94_12910 [Deltaproteobacteria bacterium SM23_61]|nr:MAG: hypothetical protein AMJ94_12910 [Deltaproteobacteria bacterium SM23_61]
MGEGVIGQEIRFLRSVFIFPTISYLVVRRLDGLPLFFLTQEMIHPPKGIPLDTKFPFVYIQPTPKRVLLKIEERSSFPPGLLQQMRVRIEQPIHLISAGII